MSLLKVRINLDDLTLLLCLISEREQEEEALCGAHHLFINPRNNIDLVWDVWLLVAGDEKGTR